MRSGVAPYQELLDNLRQPLGLVVVQHVAGVLELDLAEVRGTRFALRELLGRVPKPREMCESLPLTRSTGA